MIAEPASTSSAICTMAPSDDPAELDELRLLDAQPGRQLVAQVFDRVVEVVDAAAHRRRHRGHLQVRDDVGGAVVAERGEGRGDRASSRLVISDVATSSCAWSCRRCPSSGAVVPPAQLPIDAVSRSRPAEVVDVDRARRHPGVVRGLRARSTGGRASRPRLARRRVRPRAGSRRTATGRRPEPSAPRPPPSGPAGAAGPRAPPVPPGTVATAPRSSGTRGTARPGSPAGVSHASRPYTLITSGSPAAPRPSTVHTPAGWSSAGRRSWASTPRSPTAAATSRRLGTAAGRAEEQVHRGGRHGAHDEPGDGAARRRL